MSTEINKAIVGRWLTNCWGKTCDLGIVEEIGLAGACVSFTRSLT